MKLSFQIPRLGCCYTNLALLFVNIAISSGTMKYAKSKTIVYLLHSFKKLFLCKSQTAHTIFSKIQMMQITTGSCSTSGQAMAQGTEQLFRKVEAHPPSSFRPYKREGFVHNTRAEDALLPYSMSTSHTTSTSPSHSPIFPKRVRT